MTLHLTWGCWWYAPGKFTIGCGLYRKHHGSWAVIMLCRNGGSSSTHEMGKFHLMALQFCNGWGPCTVHFSVSRYPCWGKHGSFPVIPALLWEDQWQTEYYMCVNALYFTIFSSTHVFLGWPLSTSCFSKSILSGRDTPREIECYS